MDPIATTAARQQRVLQGVAERTRWRRSNLPALLRPALAAAILFGAGVAATAATVGHDWVARRWRELSGQAEPVLAPPRANPAAPVRRRAELAVAAPVQVQPAPEPPASIRPPVVRASVHARAARGEDPTALVEAVRALRGDHDPRARRPGCWRPTGGPIHAARWPRKRWRCRSRRLRRCTVRARPPSRSNTCAATRAAVFARPPVRRWPRGPSRAFDAPVGRAPPL